MLGNLIKSTRVNRTLPSLLLILLGVTIKGKINTSIFLLGIILVLIYSSGGILNALKDKDYKLNKKTKFIPCLIIILATLISLYDKILLITTISWISLSLIYNLKSRKILLLDTTIMSLTHYFIPFFFALIILGESITKSLELSIPLYLIFWLITPSKNLKESTKDKKLGYKTIATEFENPKKIIKILFLISILPILSLKFYFNLSNLFFLTIPSIATFLIIINTQFKQNKVKKGLQTTRIFFSFLIINLIIIKWLT